MKTQRIHHNGTDYQTRWPEHAFRTFLNVELNEDNQSIPSEKVRCPHCDNTGMVVLDYTMSDAVACPMCVIGRLHNLSWGMTSFKLDGEGKPLVVTLPMDRWCWRPSDDMAQWSWNHGLSVDHTERCKGCSEGASLPGRLCAACSAPSRGGVAA